MTVLADDEYRHPVPEEYKDAPIELVPGLWGDTLWVSVVDREANIFGINHFHLTNKGWGRFETLYVIDGVSAAVRQQVPAHHRSGTGAPGATGD